MGFFDRLFGRNRADKDRPAAARQPNRTALHELEVFFKSRSGVEAFIEPPSRVYATTLLLVAGDGEFLRRPVKDLAQAEKLCERHDVPLYAARKVGYPQRMKDYQSGRRAEPIRVDDMPPLDVIDPNS